MKNISTTTDNQYIYNPQEGIVDYFESRLNYHHIEIGDDSQFQGYYEDDSQSPNDYDEDDRAFEDEDEDSNSSNIEEDDEAEYKLMISNRDEFLYESGYDGF